MYDFFLTCPRGLENVLKNELNDFINNKIILNKGGVLLKGNKEDLYKINLKTRVGMHLLIKLFEGKIHNYMDVYKLIYHFKWHKIINHNNTFIIKTKVNSKIINNQSFCTMRIKDAIVDRIRKEENKRPSVNKINPDFLITVYIKDNNIKVYLNSSGRPLFMRGYRTKIHKAALNESLASGILKLTNWDNKKPLYDPMCGSGTFLIEAAMSAFNIPPRILRKDYSFMNWKNFDKNLWKQLIEKENNKIKCFKTTLYGSDFLANNINISKASSKKLNLDKYINFEVKNFKQIIPNDTNGIFITNPPYGYRIGETDKLKKVYKEIGDHLKTNFQGFDSYIFTGNLELIKHIGLRTKRKFILKNGKIDCRLAYYPLKSGKFKS